MRFARTATALAVAAGFAGCASEPTYNGDARLQEVKFVDSARTVVKGDASQAAMKYVSQNDELTGYDDSWKVRTDYKANGTGHVRLDQIHDGVPVWGAAVVVHSVGDKFEYVAGTRVTNLGGFDIAPTFSKEDALALGKGEYERNAKGSKSALEYDRVEQQLVIFPQPGGETKLAWRIEFHTELQGGIQPGLWNYFVDAKTGDLLWKYNKLHTIVPQASGVGGNAKVSRTWTNALDVTAVGGGVYKMDTARIKTIDLMHGTSGGAPYQFNGLSNWPDAPMNDAHAYTEIVANMLTEWYGFNSIDGNGFQLVSRVHYSNNYENAFWDGAVMTYGDGASTFYPLSGDVDVGAHEMNHGFTSFHSDLVYSGESGGMNESFSDISGTIADFYLDGDAGDWDIGGDIFKAAGEALRYMCDPTADGISIDNYADYAGQDVHYTSGIQNKAFCRFARRLASGSPDGAATQASVRRAGEAFYRANAAFWTASSTFQQGCQGTLDAARDIGMSTAEQNALRDSWVDVGVGCDGATVPIQCDETLTTAHGTISSPNYPANYPNNYSKTWCIIPASGSAATLHFTAFNTEAGWDFVTLKDGNGNEISKTSGTTAPADVTNTTIVVKFTSDSIINATGWSATW